MKFSSNLWIVHFWNFPFRIFELWLIIRKWSQTTWKNSWLAGSRSLGHHYECYLAMLLTNDHYFSQVYNPYTGEMKGIRSSRSFIGLDAQPVWDQPRLLEILCLKRGEGGKEGGGEEEKKKRGHFQLSMLAQTCIANTRGDESWRVMRSRPTWAIVWGYDSNNQANKLIMASIFKQRVTYCFQACLEVFISVIFKEFF